MMKSFSQASAYLLLSLFSIPIHSTTLTGTLTAATPAIPSMSDNSSTTTPSRFPPGTQSDAQKAAFAEAEKAVLDVFGPNFKLKDDQRNLLGPFGILSYTPETFLPYLRHAAALNTFPYITSKERELAILATASITKSAYIVYAHKGIGKGMGLTQEQVDGASEGRCPEGLEEREKLVFETALQMARGYGRIGEGTFEGAVEVVGREGVSALAQVVGAYLMNSVIVSVAGVLVPTS